ncbi:MAG: pilin, partial [Burkholderiales bacterium]
FRTSVAEKAQTDGTLLNSGRTLTVNIAGKVTGGSVTDNGVITVAGNNTATSVGTSVSMTMTPSLAANGGGVLIWTCTGSPAKYFPASCRG